MVGEGEVRLSLHVRRDGPSHLEIEDVAFKPRGLVHSDKGHGLWEARRFAGLGELARRVARPFDGGLEVEDVGHGGLQ